MLAMARSAQVSEVQEYSWANHFDYTSRGGHYSKDESIIVWTSLIGQAFLDAFEMLGEPSYLDVADSACRWILALPRENTDTGSCISYHSLGQDSIHNASMLGAALLARTWRHTRRPEYLALADAAMEYSCTRQLPTARGGTARDQVPLDRQLPYRLQPRQSEMLRREHGGASTWQILNRGFEYYFTTFFEQSGRPRYYHNRAQPIDIQCASQAIETLTKFSGDHDCRVAVGSPRGQMDDREHAGSDRVFLLSAISPHDCQGPDAALGAGDDVSRSLASAAAQKQRGPTVIGFQALSFVSGWMLAGVDDDQYARVRSKVVLRARTLQITGSVLKTARLRSELYVQLEDLDSFCSRRSGHRCLRTDILTFLAGHQRPRPKITRSITRPKGSQYFRSRHMTSGSGCRLYNKPRNTLRKALKSGIEVRLEEFSESLLHGIKAIYDESPVRQGKRNRHYQERLGDNQKRARHVLGEKPVHRGLFFRRDDRLRESDVFSRFGSLHKFSLESQPSRQSANNAILAKAVEICAAERGLSALSTACGAAGPPGAG